MSQLPEEILSHICSCLRAPPLDHERSYEDEQATLLDICLASKSLHCVARPHLYRTVYFGTKLSWEGSRRSLLRSLVEPSTARLVQHVTLGNWATPRSAALHPEKLEKEPDKPTVAAADGLNVSAELRRQIRDGLEIGTEDAEMALILCLCTRLQSLATHCGTVINESLVFAVIREAISPRMDIAPLASLPLHDLRHVKLAHWDTEGSTGFWELEDIFALPALETIHGETMDCYGRERPNQLIAITSNIKRISLDNSQLDVLGLEVLLKTCPKMEVLRVQIDAIDYETMSIDYAGFGNALRRFGSSLKTFHLDLGDIYVEEADDGEASLFENLRSLTSLRNLRAPFLSFFEREPGSQRIPITLRDMLPFSLEILQISEVDFPDDEEGEREARMETLDGLLLDLMQDPRFLNLKKIKLNRREPFSGDAKAVGWAGSDKIGYWKVLKRLETSDKTGLQEET